MPTPDRREGADLIVVGASVGGLVAAIVAADRGCHVAVVERSKELGGGASLTPEAVAAAGTRWQQSAGVRDNAERFAADLIAGGAAAGSDEMIRMLAKQSAPLVEWLADRCGAPFQLVGARSDAGGVPRLHACGEQGGASLVAALGRVVSRHHRIRMRPGTEVTDLLRENGSVTGVAVKPDRRGAPTIAGRVLLACGGFIAEDGLVTQHCGGASALPLLGPPSATGDGLRLAAQVGAATRDLERCVVTALFALPAQLEVPQRLVELGAILVNQSGRRFSEEASNPLGLAEQVRSQPGHVAYLVFDDRIATEAGADPFIEHVVLPRAGRRGSTPSDLAKQLELDAAGLEQAVSEGGTGRAHALEAPLRAIRVTGSRLRTLGGLVVEARARVLDGGGQPIAGLYAAGGVTAALATNAPAAGRAGLDALLALGLGRITALDVIAEVAKRDHESDG
jgi:fumarate reductase flavoprotein subunit